MEPFVFSDNLGRVYFVGGVDADDRWCSEVTVFDPETGRIEDGPPLLPARRGVALAASSEEIFACGGLGVGYEELAICTRLRPEENAQVLLQV